MKITYDDKFLDEVYEVYKEVYNKKYNEKTDEEILEEIDIDVIEKFLRKKKLQRIQNEK